MTPFARALGWWLTTALVAGCTSSGDGTGADAGRAGQATASGGNATAGASAGTTAASSGGAAAAGAGASTSTAGTAGVAGGALGGGGVGAAAGTAGGLGGASGVAGRGGAAGSGGTAGSGAVGGAAGAGAGAAGMAGFPVTGEPKLVLVAGSGRGGDGTPATSAAVLNPYGAVVDPVSGDVYISECDTGKIRHVDASGTITTVVGPGAPGAAANIDLNQPHDLLFQPGTQNLFIADTMNGNVYRLNAETGEVALFVGAGTPFAKLSIVYCLAFSPSGTDLYYTGPDDIRVIDLTTTTEKPAVPYAAARVIAIDSKGTLYAVKNRPNGDALQAVDPGGVVTDMPATVNVVSDPKHLSIDGDDNVLIADTELAYVRKYDVASDELVTLVGNGMTGTGLLGGNPLEAQLKRPHGVFFDKKTGVTFISDSENNRVLKIVP